MFRLTEEEKIILNKFIKDNKDRYSEYVQRFFDEEFDINEVYSYDFMLQIYSYLFTKRYISNGNIFMYFIELLYSKFPDLSRRKILEVASGYIPGFAIIMNELYKMEYSITCIDPKIINLPLSNIKLLNKKFESSMDTSMYDLILAHCPCEAFDEIVKRVMSSPTDMCVQTCPCRFNRHLNRIEFYYYLEKTIDELKSLEDKGYKVEVDETSSYYYTTAPVITVLKREFPKIKYPKDRKCTLN